MADTNTTDEIKKKRKRRKKKATVAHEAATAPTKEDVSDNATKKSQQHKKETPKQELEVPVSISSIETTTRTEGTGEQQNRLGIGDISAYIASMKQKSGPSMNGEQPSSESIPSLTASDGTDLRNLANVYAVVPHVKGDHKLVYFRSQAPEDLREDDKGRVKGGQYIKNGVKVYDVYADFKRDSVLKSRDGDHLDVWIIDDTSDLENQIQAIKNTQGGGRNFLAPVIVGSIVASIAEASVQETTELTGIQENEETEIIDSIIEDSGTDTEMQPEPEISEDTSESNGTSEYEDYSGNGERDEGSDISLEEDTNEDTHETAQEIPEISEESNVHEDEIISPVSEESEIVDFAHIDPLAGHEETPEEEISETTQDEDIDIGDISIENKDEDEGISVDEELQNTDTTTQEYESQEPATDEDSEDEITLDENTTQNEESNHEISGDEPEEISDESYSDQEEEVEPTPIEEFALESGNSQNNDILSGETMSDTNVEAEQPSYQEDTTSTEVLGVQEEPHEDEDTHQETPTNQDEEQQRDNDDFWNTSTPSTQEESHETYNTVPEYNQIQIDSTASSQEQETVSDITTTQETVIPELAAQEVPVQITPPAQEVAPLQLPSIDISDIVLEEPKEVSAPPAADTVIDTFKDGVDAIFHTHLHEQTATTVEQTTPPLEIKTMQSGVISDTSMQQLANFASSPTAVANSEKKINATSIEQNSKKKKILLIIAEVCAILLLIGAAIAMYKLMFAAPDTTSQPDVIAPQDQPIPSKEKQLQDAIKQKSGNDDTTAPAPRENGNSDSNDEAQKPVKPDTQPTTGSRKPVEHNNNSDSTQKDNTTSMTQTEFLHKLDTINEKAKTLLTQAQETQQLQAEKLLRIIMSKIALTNKRATLSESELTQDEMTDTIKRLETYLEQTTSLLE